MMMKEKAKQLLKSELAKRGISYGRLTELMNEKGYKTNENSIRAKLSRGTFSASFLMEVADVLDAEIIFKPTKKDRHG
jgi:hypothetical protein